MNCIDCNSKIAMLGLADRCSICNNYVCDDCEVDKSNPLCKSCLAKTEIFATDDNKMSLTFNGKTYSFNFNKQDLIQKIAESYVLDGEADGFITNFKKLKDAITEVEAKIKTHILDTFKNNFHERTGSISTNNSTVIISETGSKYYLDESRIEDISSELYKVKTTYSVDTKAVEKHQKEQGNLPYGIIKNENRNVAVSIRERKNMLIDVTEIIEEGQTNENI